MNSFDEFASQTLAENLEIAPQNWLDQPAPYESLIPTLLWVLLQSLLSLLAWQYKSIYDWLILGPQALNPPGFYRYLSSAFIHSDLKHLLSNLILGSIFYFLLSAYYGVKKIFWGSLGAAFLINFLSYQILFMQKTEDLPFTTQLLGSSGIVYFLGATWLSLYVLTMSRLSGLQRFFKFFGIGLLLFFPTEAFDPTISYQTHLIGFLLGFAYSGLLWMLYSNDWRARVASPL